MPRRFVVYLPDDLFEMPERTRRRGPRWSGPTKAFTMRLDAGTCDRLDELAKLYGVTRNEWIRQAIEFRIAATYYELQKKDS